MGVFGDQQQALTWSAAFILGVSVSRLVGQWLERRKEPDLHGAVANSSKLVAAWRAVESLELEGKLFTDELSGALAGHRNFSAVLAAAQPYGQAVSDGQPGRRLYKISQIPARSWWIDRAIMIALTTPAVKGNKGWLSARLTSSARGPSAPPRQLVVLGAGMDSRAWRLPMPPGLKWFEVDREDVLDAKKLALIRAGAEIPGEMGVQHPLRCARWAGVAADVREEGLLAALQAEGFDLQEPTVWVLEGVLMFFQQAEVTALLSALAGASALGSTLIGHALTEEMLEKVQTAQNLQDVPGASLYPAAVVKAWQSALPLDPTPVLAAAGWSIEEVVTRAKIANQICGGNAVGKCDFDVEESSEDNQAEVFFVAKKNQ